MILSSKFAKLFEENRLLIVPQSMFEIGVKVLPKSTSKETGWCSARKMLTLQTCKYLEKSLVRLACCSLLSIHVHSYRIEILICLSKRLILRKSETRISSFQETRGENLYIRELVVDICKLKKQTKGQQLTFFSSGCLELTT